MVAGPSLRDERDVMCHGSNQRGGLMMCDRFVFSVDGKIPGPDPANSSCDTEMAGSGPFPSSPKRWGGGVYCAHDKDLLPCHIGDFCVILCTHLLYGKLA